MMGTEEKNGQNLKTESTESTPPVTVSMKKLVAGVGTMFAGVLQMLEALEPQAAKQLMKRIRPQPMIPFLHRRKRSR